MDRKEVEERFHKGPGGAPRTVSPSHEDVIKLGEDLVEWASTPPTEDNPKMRFADWYSLEQFMILKEWKLLKQMPSFSPYYEKARTLLSKHYINAGKDDTMNAGIAHRFLRHYCWDDVAEMEDAQVEHEARAKALIDTSDHERKLIERDQRIIELEAKLRELQSK